MNSCTSFHFRRLNPHVPPFQAPFFITAFSSTSTPPKLGGRTRRLLLGEAGVHHVDDAIDGDGGLRNVGGHHDLPAASGARDLPDLNGGIPGTAMINGYGLWYI